MTKTRRLSSIGFKPVDFPFVGRLKNADTNVLVSKMNIIACLASMRTVLK